VARFFEAIARSQRRFGVYYGDSGIWVRRDVFEKLGGYPVWPLFEDYDFVRRLERFARRNRKSHRAFAVAAGGLGAAFPAWRRPRFADVGRLSILFSLGVSPHWLARIYHR
jgi:hypothetical protein